MIRRRAFQCSVKSALSPASSRGVGSIKRMVEAPHLLARVSSGDGNLSHFLGRRRKSGTVSLVRFLRLHGGEFSLVFLPQNFQRIVCCGIFMTRGHGKQMSLFSPLVNGQARSIFTSSPCSFPAIRSARSARTPVKLRFGDRDGFFDSPPEQRVETTIESPPSSDD